MMSVIEIVQAVECSHGSIPSMMGLDNTSVEQLGDAKATFVGPARPKYCWLLNFCRCLWDITRSVLILCPLCSYLGNMAHAAVISSAAVTGNQMVPSAAILPSAT